MPLTTVTIVVELSAVPVGETEFEAGGAEVEGIGVILEKVEVAEVVGVGVGEDDVNINVGVVLLGINGTSIDGTGNDIVLVFVVKNVVTREHKYIPSC